VPEAAILGLLVSAGVLITSGALKIAAPAVAQERRFLASAGLPNTPTWLLRAHPLAEVALGTSLLLFSGQPLQLVTLFVVGLFGFYLALVVRVWLTDEVVSCACFGQALDQEVGLRVALRNAMLLGFGVLAAVSSWTGPTLRTMWAPASSWWLVGVLAVLVLGWLMLPIAPKEDELGDYLRSPIPGALVQAAEGHAVTLVELARLKAQLLLFLSKGCGSCDAIYAQIPEWRRRMPTVEVRIVIMGTPHPSFAEWTQANPNTLFDVKGEAKRTLAIRGTPSAVLLGADGLLAGGPVVGSEVTLTFAEDIVKQLAEHAEAEQDNG
jgi:hypothetical protein